MLPGYQVAVDAVTTPEINLTVKDKPEKDPSYLSYWIAEILKDAICGEKDRKKKETSLGSP